MTEVVARAPMLELAVEVGKPVDFGHFAEAVATLGIYWTAMNRLPG